MAWKIINLEGMRPLQQMFQNVLSKGVTHLTPQGIQLNVICWIATNSKAKCTQWVAVMRDNMEEMELHKLLRGDFHMETRYFSMLPRPWPSTSFYSLLLLYLLSLLTSLSGLGGISYPKSAFIISSYNTSYLSKSLENLLRDMIVLHTLANW